MAEVRDGWDMRLDRPVAVKLLHPAFSVADDSRRRFEIEARAAASLNHPNIVAVHDSGDHAGTPFIVMERLSGRTLADELMRGPLPRDHVRAILGDVLSALTAAHSAGILHRDIKPANILFTPTGGVKVGDFGIAKSAETPATMTGQIVGTMAYLSPDRIAGRPATVADDLYAVGAVGYEAVTGHQPFPQENLAALARAIAETVPPPLRMLRPDVEPGPGRDDRTRDGPRSAVAIPDRRCDARLVVRCAAWKPGASADACARRPVAPACHRGGREARRSQQEPQNPLHRGGTVRDRPCGGADPPRVGITAVGPRTGDHWHVAACAADVSGDTATATPSAGADRSRSSRQEEGPRQRQRQEEAGRIAPRKVCPTASRNGDGRLDSDRHPAREGAQHG